MIPRGRQEVACQMCPFMSDTGDSRGWRQQSCDRVYEYGSGTGRDETRQDETGWQSLAMRPASIEATSKRVELTV